MALELKSRVIFSTVVIDMSGRLCFLETGLRGLVRALLEEGHRDFVLNLSDLEYIDSFGLGQMVSVWTSIHNRGGQMKLLQPGERVLKLLELTKLTSVFEIATHDDTVLQ